MKLKDALKEMVVLFCVITTCVILFMSLIPLYDSDGFIFTARDLYKIPLVALLGTIPLLILVRKETASKTEVNVRKVLHFVLTAGLVLGTLMFFGWLDTTSAVSIIVFFLALYIAVWIVASVREKRLADKLNERINAFHSGENATHKDGP